MKKVLFYLSTMAIILLIGGCFLISTESTLRLYNLNNGHMLRVTVLEAFENHGSLQGILPGGETLTGEYFIRPQPTPPVRKGGSIIPLKIPSGVDTLAEARWDTTSWERLYGIGKNTPVVPVGSAVLVGDRGTVIQIVFFSFNWKDWIGDGVGKDNRGNIYRVYLGGE